MGTPGLTATASLGPRGERYSPAAPQCMGEYICKGEERWLYQVPMGPGSNCPPPVRDGKCHWVVDSRRTLCLPQGCRPVERCTPFGLCYHTLSCTGPVVCREVTTGHWEP